MTQPLDREYFALVERLAAIYIIHVDDRWWEVYPARRDWLEALLEIRRTAWCGHRTLRESRRTLRPVLFDAAAAARTILVYASDRPLTRWIEG